MEEIRNTIIKFLLQIKISQPRLARWAAACVGSGHDGPTLSIDLSSFLQGFAKKVLQEGNNERFPKRGNTVKVHYVGTVRERERGKERPPGPACLFLTFIHGVPLKRSSC
jgi:hypothetical protein